MINLLRYWPREIAFPERIICNSLQEFIEILNKYNGIKNRIYYSLYNCGFNRDYNNFAMIDKIGFDIDNSIDAVKRLYKYCDKYNYRYLIVFSTRGFWFYIFTKNYENLRNKKQCLKNAQKFVCDECGLTIGDSKSCDVDIHCVGDIARIARCPNTYDVSRKLYCIPVTKKDVENGISYVRKIAARQNFNFRYYNTGFLDVSVFEDFSDNEEFDFPEYDYSEDKINDDMLKDFLPCVREWLTNPEKGVWKARWYAGLYLRDLGYSKRHVDKIFKKYFSKMPRTDNLRNNYEHVKKVKLLDYVFSQRDDFFPKCETLYREGLCRGKCKFYNSFYK